jgi:hypothetical protein
MEKKSEIYVCVIIDSDDITVGKPRRMNICRNIYAKQK